MKRHLSLLAILSLISALPLGARERQTWDDQPYKYEVTLGVSHLLLENTYDIMTDNFGSSSLDLIYAPQNGPIYTAGGYSVEFGLAFRNWFTLAFNASASGIWHDTYDNITGSGGRKSGAQVSVMPVARLSWLRGRTFKMHSSFGVGGGVTVYDGKTLPHLALCFIPVGMQFGDKVYGIAEWGIGKNANMQALRVGIGMKF